MRLGLSFLATLLFRGASWTIPIDGGATGPYEAGVAKAQRHVRKECPEDGGGQHAKKCEEQLRARQLHAFNQQVSDRLPLDRAIPDTRASACGLKSYDIKATVSVIIPFYHEGTTTLLRTAQSVLTRTPPELLNEIVLVNDGADSPWSGKQKKQISKWASTRPKVKVLVLEEHLGLATAKIAGVRSSKGDIVAFLDSHCEVNVGWYEPLAAAIQEDRGTIANPVIDAISNEDFRYLSAGVNRGVFTWGMYFAGEKFDAVTEMTAVSGGNVPTPVMPGGLFAVDRQFFENLGFYDEGLRVWGGENIELSIKAWRCGGRVIFVPCSRVGHVYKSVDHRFPAGESLHKNFKRIAEVWLDEYKDIYYKSFPESNLLPAGDLTKPLAVRERLQCKSMSWFIENVYPTMFVPRSLIAEGLLSSAKNLCLHTNYVEIASNPRQEPHRAPAVLRKCMVMSNHNQWYFTADTSRLVHIGIWTEECLGVHGRNQEVVVCQCARYPNSGCSEEEIRWQVSSSGFGLVHQATGLCLQSGKGIQLQVAKCDATLKTQSWTFVNRSTLASRDVAREDL